jgi:hypothetical protein
VAITPVEKAPIGALFPAIKTAIFYLVLAMWV